MSGDRAVAAVARRQKGLITRDQLRAAGLDRGAIAHRVSQSRLHRLHRGVYLVGHRVPPPMARELAAVLACGEGAVLSRESAAAVWGFYPPRGGPVHVTAPGRRASRPGIHVHRTTTLEPRDVRRRHGIPLTSPLRTLHDLSRTLPLDALERAAEEAWGKRLIKRSEVEALVGAQPGLTRSEAERQLRRLLRKAGIAPDETNYVLIPPYEVDMYWREARLIVEIDGWESHKTRTAFEHDRRRDAVHTAAGFRMMRVTGRQVRREPEATIARIARAGAA